MPEPLLRVDRLEVWYGSIQALFGISFELRAGEMVGLLGANGAGKSTILRALSGLLAIGGGDAAFGGHSLRGRSVERIVSLGIAHVPERRRIFPGLTVLENLEMGAVVWRRRGESLTADYERVFELFPHLVERRNQHGWSLSGGEQQMLAIGRAVMARPKLLLLDEPSLGLAPLVAREVFRAIGELNRDQHLTVLLVEQNARMALGLIGRGYVLERGEIVLAGDAAELARHEQLEAAYLGG